MKTLIKNATVVLPGETNKIRIIIEDDKIACIDAAAHARADETLDANGLHLIPGVIDDQVHFREPGATHKEDLASGSRACARGGVTTFLEMPNTSPTTTTVQRLDEKLALAAEKCLVNYGFYIGATPENLAELQKAERTPGIKVFIGSSTGDLLVDDQDALERIFAETTLPICAHCEDEQTVRRNRELLGEGSTYSDHSRIRDHEAAVVATRRALDLALRHRHRFHVLHVSTADEVPIIKEGRGFITAEVCPHHLFFNIEDYERLGSLVQMNPSVKTAADNAALWAALLEGAIQVVATDHAPHTLEEKQAPYPKSPSGVPAVENLLALMLNQAAQGVCTIENVVDWLCDGPMRLWDLVGKGKIVEGWDADLVLVDMNKTAAIRNEDQVTRCGWSPWKGAELTGWPVRTWVMGREVWRADKDDPKGIFDESVRGVEARYDHSRGGYWIDAT